MARSRLKSKGRADVAPVTYLPKAMLESAEYAALTAAEVKLLLDIAVQFNGYTNNGDLHCNFALMKVRGWRSQATLWRALSGLLEKGFLIKTRQGGKHRCSLFAVTWREVHDCKGKHDSSPTRTAKNNWRRSPQISPPKTGTVQCQRVA